jgi:regulatory protein
MPDDDKARRRPDGAASGADAYAKAIELLAARAHFRAELASKLERRGFPPPAIEDALERLAAAGFVDDQAAARAFARQRAARQGWGPARLRAELARRRVDEATVQGVVAEAFADGELAAARAAAERWPGRGRGDRQRLARYLDRRGFSKATIVEILSRTEAGESSAHEEL